MENLLRKAAGQWISAALCVLFSAIGLTLASCGGLSSQEEKMVGKYYIPAVSDSHPLIELNADRTSVLSASRPGEITFSVTGTWKVDGDSLIIESDPASITIEEGDPGMVGTVATRVAYPIKDYNETTLSIERDGITYDYHRRME